MLGAIAYADNNNLIPVIDMKNHKNSYLYDNELGRINSWEYYFEQPCGIGVDEALSNRKYIIGRNPGFFEYPRCAQNPQSFIINMENLITGANYAKNILDLNLVY